MNRFNPKVSIVIPVYNGANFLEQAIKSALAQTYQHTEIIVINDGSTDKGKTHSIARKYGNRIKYYSKKNGGVASALNLGIEKMSGEFFSWLSHDDLYTPHKISSQIKILSQLTDKNVILYNDFAVFTKDPNNYRTIRLKNTLPEHFRFWITVENRLQGCTLLIPKQAFTICGTFKEDLKTTQDYDLWFKMAGNYKFVHHRDITVKMRLHDQQGTHTMTKTALAECNTLLTTFVNGLNPDELKSATGTHLAKAYAIVAMSMWKRNFASPATVAVKKSFQHFNKCVSYEKIIIIFTLLGGFSKYMISRFTHLLIPAFVIKLIQKLRYKILSLSKNIFHLAKHQIPRSKPFFSHRRLKNLSLKERFSEVYHKNIFKGQDSLSGEGSNLMQTHIIRKKIPKLIKQFNINSFLDAPCGDYHWMQKTKLGVKQYIGADIVDVMIKKNNACYATDNIKFKTLNLAEDPLPKTDLIFSRDCLVHLSFADALRILANFKRTNAQYLLTTTFTQRTKNSDLGKGFWRPLNKNLAPFNFPEPLALINEGCTEGNNRYTDKSLGLWRLSDINLP